MKKPLLAVTVAGALSIALPAQAQIYEWTDDRGKTQFGDTPPKDRPFKQRTETDLPYVHRQEAPKKKSGDENPIQKAIDQIQKMRELL